MAGQKKGSKKAAGSKKKTIEMIPEKAIEKDSLTEMMAADGPIVQVIKLAVNGEITQIKVDMNPKANSLEKLLGGPVTFVGMYDEGDLIVMSAKKGKGANKCSLPAPFEEEKVKGDMLVVKMDSSSEPHDITLKQWNKFVKEVRERPPPEEGEEEEEEEDDEELMDDDEDEDDEDDEEMELGSDEEDDDPAQAIEAILSSQIISSYHEEHGREPTREEVEEMLSSMKESGVYEKAAERIGALLAQMGDQGQGGSEEEESEEEEEEVVQPKKKSRRK